MKRRGGQNVKLIPLKRGYTENSRFSHLFLIYLFLLLCCELKWISLRAGSANPVHTEVEHMPRFWHVADPGMRVVLGRQLKWNKGFAVKGGPHLRCFPPPTEPAPALATQLLLFLAIHFKSGRFVMPGLGGEGSGAPQALSPPPPKLCRLCAGPGEGRPFRRGRAPRPRDAHAQGCAPLPWLRRKPR